MRWGLGAMVLVVASVAEGGAPKPSVAVTLIGHEGFLVRVGREAVLLDGFLVLGKDADDTLLRPTYDRMLSGKAPFGGVNVALVSHEHKDHFNVEVATGFLERHPETHFPAPPEVYAALKQGSQKGGGPNGRLTELAWVDKDRVAVELGAVRVVAYRFAHEAHEFFSIDVGLYLVTINGVKILHAADAELTAEHLDALGLEKEDIDVAFLPYSFFAQPGAAKVFKEQIAAKQTVVMHLPAANTKEAKAVVTRHFPKAVFFARPLETRSL